MNSLNKGFAVFVFLLLLVSCASAGTKELGEQCSINSVCLSGNCINEICGNCYSDQNCTSTEACINNACMPPGEGCGYPENHEWIEYACCEDSDCEEGMFCSEENSCEPGEDRQLSVNFVPKKPIEGERFKIFVNLPGHNILEGAKIEIDGKHYIAFDGSITTLMDSGIHHIKAYEAGYITEDQWFRVYGKARIVVETEEATVGNLIPIKLAGSEGEPLREVELVVAFPDGEKRVLKSNKDGYVFVQSYLAGKIKLSIPNHTGYVSGLEVFSVSKAFEGSFNLDFSGFMLPLALIGAVLLAFLVFAILKRRKGDSSPEIIADEF